VPESSPVLIGVIFVLYHDYDSFETLLQSQEDLPPNMHIVVVDNSEPEFVHPQRLENLKKDMHIEVISAPDNPGYFGAANRAMGLSSRLRASKWVCVSNVDLAIDLASVYEVLQDFDVPTDLAIGALAPMVRDCSGAPMKQPELPTPCRYLPLVLACGSTSIAQRLLTCNFISSIFVWSRARTATVCASWCFYDSQSTLSRNYGGLWLLLIPVL